ncbi:MAG: hypothetical protein RIF36_11565 [Imperialibacter sp.]|uniref:hypothetical protein n=1 Tax=Imperialibacter sp. TaxID=2038411 RepID=UPI0032ECD755
MKNSGNSLLPSSGGCRSTSAPSFLAIGHTYTSFRWAGMTLVWAGRLWPLYRKITHNDVISIRQPAERNPHYLALVSNAGSETI